MITIFFLMTREEAPKNKSRTHLALQRYLLDLLPRGKVEMEKKFPDIGRIADIVWEEKKLLFEIQCSPMSREEMLNRTKVYKRAGYQTVWILHERSYNKFRLSALEGAVKEIPHYFTNMSPGGEGIIYDQCSIVSHGTRIKSWKRLPIDLSSPRPISLEMLGQKKERLAQVEQRLNTWPIYFYQDLISIDQEELESREYQEAISFERSMKKPKESLLSLLKRAYLSFLDRALKSYCG